MNLGIASRVATFASLVLLLAIGALTVQFSRQSEHQLEELMGARLESIAATGAPRISGDKHEQIHQKSDFDGADYQLLQKRLASIAEANHAKPYLVYTLRAQNQFFEFVAMADPTRNDIGNRYERVPPELRDVLATGKASHRGRYETENGTWISGFAPIVTDDGRAVGVLEVDYEISEFIKRYSAELTRTMLIASIALVIGVILIFLVIRATTRRIVLLTNLADAISRGEVERQVPAMGQDEVGRLAQALERLRESVRTSLELLGGGADR